MEESPVGDSQKNGVIERCIWEVESLARINVHQASEMHRTKFALTHPLRIWAVHYAGQLLSRFQRSAADGKTAYERRKGKHYKRQLPWFGECVMFLTVAKGKRRQKYEDRFVLGCFVGLVDRSDEVYVLTETGAYKANCMRRLPAEQKGDALFASRLKGLPWCMVPGEQSTLLDVKPFLATEPIVPEDQLPLRLPSVGSSEPRRVYIRREVELRPRAEGGYGLTDGCPGCDAARSGLVPRPHSEACRRRIESEMLASRIGSDRVRAAQQRLGVVSEAQASPPDAGGTPTKFGGGPGAPTTEDAPMEVQGPSASSGAQSSNAGAVEQGAQMTDVSLKRKSQLSEARETEPETQMADSSLKRKASGDLDESSRLDRWW